MTCCFLNIRSFILDIRSLNVLLEVPDLTSHDPSMRVPVSIKHLFPIFNGQAENSENSKTHQQVVKWLCFSYINLNKTRIFYCSMHFHCCLLFRGLTWHHLNIVTPVLLMSNHKTIYCGNSHKMFFIKTTKFWLFLVK